MSGSYLEKNIWDEADWEVFFHNLDILRSRSGLKKKEFSDKVGVKNIYRKDINRPDRRTLLEICRIFNVALDWFAVPQQIAPEGSKSQRGSTILTGRLLTSEQEKYVAALEKIDLLHEQLRAAEAKKQYYKDKCTELELILLNHGPPECGGERRAAWKSLEKLMSEIKALDGHNGGSK